MSLKHRIPFSIKHRLRRMVDYLGSRPSHYASGPMPEHGRLRRRYRSWYRERRFGRLFAALLQSGDLVFDIGANVGDWTTPLRSLGCRVVAVEPQPACADRIRARHRSDTSVAVVSAAIAGSAGELELFLSPESEHATTSRGWIDSMVSRGGYAPGYWECSVTVPARTLDDLIDEFGVPAYVKLDVEGSEPEALRGLTQPIRLVSFETHGQTLDDARACVQRLCELGTYEFNLTPGEFPELEWDDWRNADDLMRALASRPFGWNNVFARLIAGHAEA